MKFDEKIQILIKIKEFVDLVYWFSRLECVGVFALRYENEKESYEYSLAYHAMVTVDTALYVIGGYTTVKYLNSAKKFEPLTKTWSEVLGYYLTIYHSLFSL